MSKFHSRLILVLQLLGTLAIIVYVPNSTAQVVLLLLLWLITFYPLTRLEIVIFIITCIFFTIADILVIYRNVFEFSHVDIWGMPLYEPFVWGFYFLHSMRMIGDTSSYGNLKKDFYYTGYLILIGILVEITGTYFGVWHYNIENYVAWWIITWGAAGLMLHRVIIPLGMRIAGILNPHIPSGR